MQTISLETFWSRYGQTDYKQTQFAQALARLPEISASGPWVAGGAVRRLVMDIAQDSDYDFFFANAVQRNVFEAQMIVRGAKKVFQNEFNSTFILPAADKLPELKVQAVFVSYESCPENVIDKFDFSLCKCVFDGTNLFFGTFTLFDLANKRLVPERITFGVSSIRRMLKYVRQGYTICGGGIQNILEQIVADPKIINANIKYID